MRLSRFIYLSVCQQNYSKTTGQIFIKFSGEVDMGHGMNPLNFGDDPGIRQVMVGGYPGTKFRTRDTLSREVILVHKF